MKERLHAAFSLGIALLLAPAAPAQSTPAWLESLLRTARPGDALALGGNTLPTSTALNTTPNTLVGGGAGSLIYSDDPETVEGFGILYEDVLPAGSHRVYTYHVNGTTTRSKVTVVLQEPSAAADVQVSLTGRALPTPSANYQVVGRTAVQQFYAPFAPIALTVPSGGAVLLDAGLDSTGVSNNQLLHGIHDFTCSGPVRVTVLHLPAATPTLANLTGQTMLPDDGFEREGTFAATTKSRATPYAYSMANGIRRLRLADGNATFDPDLTGSDAVAATTARLRGGYGLAYQIDVRVTGVAGRRLAVLLSARGGPYGGYFRTTYGNGAPTGQMVPAAKNTVAATTEAGVVAVLEPTVAPQTLRIETMPAGAMALPIELHLVPFSPPPAHGWVAQ